MATAVHIPVSEYLRTTYRPDRDYVDGALKARHVGEQPHAHIQAIISGIFRENRKLWAVRALTEQRVQITSTRYRIPDICVIRSTDPKSAVIDFSPLLCVEVLSADDSLSELQERVDDYAAIGAQAIWVIDPWKRRGYGASTEGFHQPADGILTIPDTPIRISLAEVFAELDEF